MINELLVSGAVGATIVIWVSGLVNLKKVWLGWKSGKSFSLSIKENLGRKIFNWLSSIFALLFMMMIVLGLAVSIVMGS